MTEKISKLIPKAIQAIKNSKIADKGNVQKEFKGYIPSMGASILQAGLLPTIAFYANDTNKNADSSKLLDAILRLIKSDYIDTDKLINYIIEKSVNADNNNKEIKLNDLDFNKLYLIEEDITDALIALKLALRTFKIVEE